MELPALIKVICCFGLILALNRLRVHLSLCLFVGAVVVAFWMGQSPGDIANSLVASLTSLETIQLVAIICLILVVSQLMKVSGQLDRIVEKFVAIAQDAATVSVVMPALIGLLPMPGGALFSAPMVETAVAGCSLSQDRKTAVNYWFRHIWEFWWPLYPGVVLAVSLLQVEMWRFILIQAPLTIIAVAAGTVFLLRPLREKGSKGNSRNLQLQLLGSFLWEAMPIMVVIVCIVFLALLRNLLVLSGLSINLPSALPLILGLLACLAWVMRVNRLGFRDFLAALFHRNTVPMLLLIFGIMAFKGALVDSQAVLKIREEMVQYQIPFLMVVVAMPLISGFITGITIGFVGASFPLLVPLFTGLSPFDFLLHASLAYVSGYVGMMLSPVHICLLVTKDYFKASMAASYRLLYKYASFLVTCFASPKGLLVWSGNCTESSWSNYAQN
jgi:integral membrane protein (TIGR00529 family)